MTTDDTRDVRLSDVPRLARQMRLTHDDVRGQYVLLGPETVSVLNRPGAEILRLCDGTRTVGEVADALRATFAGVDADEVARFVGRLAARRWLELGQRGSDRVGAAVGTEDHHE